MLPSSHISCIRLNSHISYFVYSGTILFALITLFWLMYDCKMYLRRSLKTVILILVLILPLVSGRSHRPLLVLSEPGYGNILVQGDYDQEPPAPR